MGAEFPDAAGQVGMIWLVLAYLLHTTGELCLSPVGLSAVTKLSIGSVVGVSMGTWFLATALSETVATRTRQDGGHRHIGLANPRTSLRPSRRTRSCSHS